MKNPLSLAGIRSFLVAALLLPTFAWGASGTAAAPDPPRPRVTAVIPPDSPPTYFRDATGKPAGFAVDIMDAVAERAGLSVSYVFEDSWADIIALVKSGKADLAPGMGVSRDREKDFAFSTPIDAFPIALFVRAEHRSIEASPGVHAVGVIRGSVAFERLKRRADVRLTTYEGFPEGLFELLAGRIDAFACPAPTLWQLARDSGVEDRIKVVDAPVAEITRAIAVRKDDGALLERLNAAIGRLVGTPAYQEIYVRWYGKPNGYWTARRVLWASAVVVLVVSAFLVLWRYVSQIRLNRELAAAIVDRDKAASVALQNQERLESLVRISQYRATNVQDLLNYALEEAIRFTVSRIGYIYHYSEASREFRLNTWSRDVMKECSVTQPQTVYQLESTGIWGEAVRQRRPIMVNDFSADHPLKRGYPAGHATLHRFLTVPVVRSGLIVAVIGVANKERPYDETDVTQLTQLMTPVWEIVERMEAEAALQKSEKQIRDIAASLGEGLYVLDDRGCVTFMNPEAERLLGWSEQELLDKNIHDVIHNRLPDGSPLLFEKCQMHNVIRSGKRFSSHDEVFIRRDGSTLPVSVISMPLLEDGRISASVTAFRDISDLKDAELQRERIIRDLQRALVEIKTLHGILPICASCKKIRDDEGAWHQMEEYIRDHTDAEFSHGLCADCAKKLYPGYQQKKV